MRPLALTWLLAALLCFGFPTQAVAGGSRLIVSLDGEWQLEEGSMAAPPAQFSRRVAVPGLTSLATPPFSEPPGPPRPDRDEIPKDPARDAFWYRRTFKLSSLSPVAMLKVSKAMFGTKVILNDVVLGEHLPNFTPGYFDAAKALRIGENELLIRVGADPAALPAPRPWGRDYEKTRYIPGIFDSVELLLSRTPHILNVQIAPEIETKSLLARVQLLNRGKAITKPVSFIVREWRTRAIVARAKSEPVSLGSGEEGTVDVRISIPGARLWSPEDPFLYTLETDSGGDRLNSRFGMRSFKLDPVSGRAILNGQPYYLRGSNITLYRFFEDEPSGTLPWDREWVRRLHKKVKGMHWNSLRYCIGFPPEFWYDIADEEGILIQDEYPMWGPRPEIPREELAAEYREWMRERWNHPSVVIWDASNETDMTETVPAIAMVKDLDLSSRPWDNSYSPPVSAGDSFESHPYHFMDRNFKLRDLATAPTLPQGNVRKNDQTHAVIINEYGYLWLNRDGSPTTLTKELYTNLLGPNATTELRQKTYALYLAAETEFWRAYRHAAAVMHFTALGYSRPDGQTSDHWTDVANLTWEPFFYRYVRDAFAPVGLMIEAWASEYPASAVQDFPVVVINDLYAHWAGRVRLQLFRKGAGAGARVGDEAGVVVAESFTSLEVEPNGRGRVVLPLKLPSQPGAYRLEAALLRGDDEPVRSVREFEIK